MSLYNMLHGVTQATFFFLPMLGKHPDEYPRFRDCFLKDEEHPEYDNHIHVYTRTGGGNREVYETENEEMRSMKGFVADFDDSFDGTFASWIFKVPEKWEADFAALIEGRMKDVSPEYREQMKNIYPKLATKFDELFGA